MQINVTEVELRAGLALYLKDRGFTGVTAENLQVTFKAGRKGSGMTAVVTELNIGGVPTAKQVEVKDDNGTTRLKAETTGEVTVKETPVAAVVEPAVVQAEVAKDPEPVAEVVAEQAETKADEGTSLFAS